MTNYKAKGESKHKLQTPVLTPFDSLLLPYINQRDRLHLAAKTSEAISANVINHYNEDALVPFPTEYFPLKSRRKLKIGFISHDFNAHPTAHLVEAIFVEINRYTNSIDQRNHSSDHAHVFFDVNLYIYSYGKDDNSTYRKSLEAVSYLLLHCFSS